MYMCNYTYTYIYIRELAHARPPMSSISLVIWGERERVPPLMMSALASVRPRTSRRLRMRDIHAAIFM